jgi:PAS domain S-box-containing protein
MDLKIITDRRCDEAIVLECIGDGVVTIDLDMRIRYMNRAMRELLGYEQDELLGQALSCHFFVQGSICSTQDCILERAIRNREKVRNYETVIQNKEGRKIPVSLNTDLLWDETGNLIGIVETYRDLSQINELKAKLERQVHPGARGPLIGRSKALQRILDVLPQVANSKATVLIEGESGTGKELIARELHRQLRSVGRGGARKRAVRSRQGRLYGGDRRPSGEIRNRTQGHLVPR